MGDPGMDFGLIGIMANAARHPDLQAREALTCPMQ
jgi:hypothetical protein